MQFSAQSLSSMYLLPGCSWPVDSIVEGNDTISKDCSHTEHDCEIVAKKAMFP